MKPTTIDDYVILILTHGRFDNQVTENFFRRRRSHARIVFVLDSEDESAPQFIEKYGKDSVYIFDMEEAKKKTDYCDNFVNQHGTVVAARNMTFDIARDLGYDYFLVLDDDYDALRLRWDKNEEDPTDTKLYNYKLINIDPLLNWYFDFLRESNADCVAFSQGGDFIGGFGTAHYHKGLSRKIMNVFFCATDKPFKFYGRTNEDVNAYVLGAMQGKLFLTVTNIQIDQASTQQNAGGLTEIYLQQGTYVKSFYSVIIAPSAVDISIMNTSHSRVHHHVNWENTAPKILDEKYRKWKKP